jgi:membrane associated rhomboid family serine protease
LGVLFFPFRVDLELRRTPWVTILVCILCIWVFILQVRSAIAHEDAVAQFCSSLTRVTQMIIGTLPTQRNTSQCAGVFGLIRNAEDSDEMIVRMALEAGDLSFYEDEDTEQQFIQSRLRTSYQEYLRRVPSNLTDELDYEPLDRQVLNMLTSTVTHGDIYHLIFNLLFFFAFAAAVEVIAGSGWFVGIFALSALTTSLAYSSNVAGSAEALPTIGLSGVVMAMMALLAVLAPGIRIRCFFWFVVVVKIFRVPALVLAAWYLAGDLIAFDSGANPNINYVAHISGAATGALLGAGFWVFGRRYLNRVLPSI